MTDFELPVAFYFELSISGINGDAAFKEVSGIEMELETEDVANGGDNRFKYKLPKAMKFNNLVCKRGLVTKDSQLSTWCNDLFSSGLNATIKPKEVQVTLKDSEGNPSVKWSFANAYPVKWSINGLDSMKNEIVIETIEFAYNYFERK